ncbi:MAG: tetratricopeptide repeat protein, partial [Dehalococcoidales bacterium]
MTYQEERLARLNRQRSRQAVDLAMRGQWQEAVVANQLILGDFPGDIEAFNRLGRAFIELGEYAGAREAYRKAAEIDPYNTIAQKNLQRLKYLGEESAPLKSETRQVEPQHFIEEIGKAGVVNLVHLASQEVRAKMISGDEVSLKIDSAGLVAADSSGEYLGLVEPRHGL